MGAFGDLPHGRWVRPTSPGIQITREQRPSLIGGLILAGALALLLWRAMSEIANGSDSRGISVGTPVPGLAANDRRYALIVSVDRYDDASLSSPGPSRDAEELHGALMTHAGFPPANIRRVDGSGPDAMIPTRNNVLRAFHELLTAIPDDGNAMLLVAFTGHGLSADGKAYLLPKDAITRGGASLLASTSIDFDVDIRQRLVARRMKQLVLLVDSTVGGPAAARDRSAAERRLRRGGDGRSAAAHGRRGRRPRHVRRVALVRRSRRAAVALHPGLRGGRARRGQPGPRRMDHARVAAALRPGDRPRTGEGHRRFVPPGADGVRRRFLPQRDPLRPGGRAEPHPARATCAARCGRPDHRPATCTSSTSRPLPGPAPRPRWRRSTS